MARPLRFGLDWDLTLLDGGRGSASPVCSSDQRQRTSRRMASSGAEPLRERPAMPLRHHPVCLLAPQGPSRCSDPRCFTPAAPHLERNGLPKGCPPLVSAALLSQTDGGGCGPAVRSARGVTCRSGARPQGGATARRFPGQWSGGRSAGATPAASAGLVWKGQRLRMGALQQRRRAPINGCRQHGHAQASRRVTRC